jgi:hypothetical protein
MIGYRHPPLFTHEHGCVNLLAELQVPERLPMQMDGTNLGLLYVGLLTPRLIPAARRRRIECGIADLGDKRGQKLATYSQTKVSTDVWPIAISEKELNTCLSLQCVANQGPSFLALASLPKIGPKTCGQVDARQRAIHAEGISENLDTGQVWQIGVPEIAITMKIKDDASTFPSLANFVIVVPFIVNTLISVASFTIIFVFKVFARAAFPGV